MSSSPKGCKEYRDLSRRGLIASAGALATNWIPRVAYTQEIGPVTHQTSSKRDIVVTVFLRGGADGLALCAPWKDNKYADFRNTLRVLPPTSTDVFRKAVDLDGFFGLPQAMSPLKELYTAKRLAFAHMTGSTNDTRSHFDAQQFMEVGIDDKAVWTGWMARHLASTSELKAGAVFRALGVNGAMPLILDGGPKTSIVSDFYDSAIGGRDVSLAKRMQWLTDAYAAADPKLKEAASNVQKTVDMLHAINFASYIPAGGAVYNPDISSTVTGGTVKTALRYPYADFGDSMRAAAAIIRADVGVEAVHVDFGGWDTHNDEGIFEGRDGNGNPIFGDGFLLLRSLASNLLAFYKDLDGAKAADGTVWSTKVTVVVVSEFGRTVNENGNLGTDHGHGNAMLFLGRNVNGGKVDRVWKNLGPDGIDAYGGLVITTDYRVYLGELLDRRLRNYNQLSKVFPGFKKPTTGWRGIFASS